MSTPNRVVRGAVRAATGVVVVGAAATAVLLLSTFTAPTIERTPPAVVVDTQQDSTQELVCAGSFAVLGADPGRPEAAIPVGNPSLVIAGDAEATATLARAEDGGAEPAVIAAPAGEPFGAAQVQDVESGETTRGVAASACAAPLNEQWLLGGDTLEGVTTTLNLGNPGEVPATVQISTFDEDGRVEGAQSTAILVPPGTQQTVSLNGYAPNRARLAVKVESTGAPITASLNVVHALAIDPFAVATVTRQSEPTTTLVVPGVANADRSTERGPNDVGDSDPFKVTVRVLAPGGQVGTAQVRALSADGDSLDLGTIALVGDAVGQLEVSNWPESANAIVVDADVPVIGGVFGSIDTDDEHDYAWFTPAPELAADELVAAPVVGGGRLVIANLGDEEATVELIPADDGESRTARVPAGGAAIVPATSDGMISSSVPVYAGVRYLDGGDIEGYPVLAPAVRDGSLTVYTR